MSKKNGKPQQAPRAPEGSVQIADLNLAFWDNNGQIFTQIQGGAHNDLAPFMAQFEKSLDVFSRALALEVQAAVEALIKHQTEIAQSAQAGKGAPTEHPGAAPLIVLPGGKGGKK